MRRRAADRGRRRLARASRIASRRPALMPARSAARPNAAPDPCRKQDPPRLLPRPGPVRRATARIRSAVGNSSASARSRSTALGRSPRRNEATVSSARRRARSNHPAETCGPSREIGSSGRSSTSAEIPGSVTHTFGRSLKDPGISERSCVPEGGAPPANLRRPGGCRATACGAEGRARASTTAPGQTATGACSEASAGAGRARALRAEQMHAVRPWATDFLARLGSLLEDDGFGRSVDAGERPRELQLARGIAQVEDFGLASGNL